MYKHILFLISFVIIFCSCEHKAKNENYLSGEFTQRINLSKERLTGSKYNPEFTADFILADVDINPENPRRFDNYSGDLSGRFIEAFSSDCHDHCSNLDELVHKLITFQQPDGRFGDKNITYKEVQIGADHMPLLWGNGRLLVGLLEYYKQKKEDAVLSAAIRLGDFFLNTYREVTPAVMKKLDGRGADGIICFTQYIEGLVLLSQVSNDSRYAEAAGQIYPMITERGSLHTHGYLTTLRGVLDLYEYDKDKQHLNYVVDAYSDLINSDDYTIYGSVKEYFGKTGERDEGCSTSDFIRLSLHLYRITEDISYLERAEYAMYNALYFNQYFTGDFGSHTVNNFGAKSETIQAAWWCCTMAGLRVMQIIKNDYFVENKDALKINMFIDTDYDADGVSLSLKKNIMADDYHIYEIFLHEIKNQKEMMIRKPSWADEMIFYINAEKTDCQLANGYFLIDRPVRSNDIVQIRMKYRCNVITHAKEKVRLSEIDRQIFGALLYGPHLMAIDNVLDYCFLAEPNFNTVYVNTIRNGCYSEALSPVLSRSFLNDAYLTAFYKHDGFPSYYQTVFRPVSEMTFQRHPYMMVSMNFVQDSKTQADIDNKLIRTWVEL